MDEFTHWRVWPFARGAFGYAGGHCCILGVRAMWSRTSYGYHSISFFRLINRQQENDNGSVRWRFAKLSVHLHRV